MYRTRFINGKTIFLCKNLQDVHNFNFFLYNKKSIKLTLKQYEDELGNMENLSFDRKDSEITWNDIYEAYYGNKQ